MGRLIFAGIFLCLTCILQGQGNSVIKGTVTDTNGIPLEGATVVIEGTSTGANAGKDGTFIFSNLHSGVYKLRVTFIGYEQAIQEVKVDTDAMIVVRLKPEPYLTGEVLVNATRAGDHTPVAYSTIGREVLQKSNVVSDIPYLLSLTPSLVETSEAGTGIGYTGMRIRGTDANRINVTIDGIPLNDPESHTVFWVDLPDIASSVDNVQIQRGVGTSSNGAGAFGATVSLQTSNPGNQPFAELNSSYGSFNTYKNTISASTGLLAEKFALQMRYSDLHSDGFIDRSGSDHRSAFISGLFRTKRSFLKANIILGEEHTGLGWWGVPADSLESNRTFNPAGQYTDSTGTVRFYDNETDNYNQNHYQLIYSFKPGENVNLNAAIHYTKGKGYYEEYREDQDFTDYSLNPVISGNGMITSTDMIRRKWLDNDFVGMTWSLNYTKSRMEVTFGGGLNTYLGDHYGTIIWMRNAGGAEKDYRWYFNDSKKSEFSVFGKMNYALSLNTRVYADLQYRFIDYDMNGIDDDLKDLSQRHMFNFINPKAGLFHTINDNQDVWLSLAVANREPTRNDFKEASGDPDAIPEPETLYDLETGYKLQAGKSAFAVNLYGMFYKDQLVPTGELSDVGYPIMTNVPNSYRIGVEFTSSVQLLDNLNWNSNITLSRNKIKNFIEFYTDYNSSDWTSSYLSKELGTVDIAYSPSAVVTSDLGYGKDWFAVHFISKYVGRQYFDNTMSSKRAIDPYLVNNLRFEVSPRIRNINNINLQLLINNIFNSKYENNAYGGNWYEDGVEKTWAYYFPQAGINYMLKLAIRF